MFNLCSEILVGNYKFSGVHDCVIGKSMRSFIDTATVVLPHIWYLKKKNGDTLRKLPTDIVKEGDKISIKLGYNGDYREEFAGFVTELRVNGEYRCEVSCEGYSYQMRNNVDVSKHYPKVTVKQLLKLITDRTDIKAVVQDNVPFEDLLLTAASGIDICEAIQRITGGALSIYFVNPTTLWCGLVNTNYVKQVASQGASIAPLQVAYRLGWNCPKDNSLKRRVLKERVRLIVNGMGTDGHRVETTAERKTADRRVVATLNNVRDAAVMKAIAEELMNLKNYEGFEGKFTGFLQPYCQPGWVVNVQVAGKEKVASATQALPRNDGQVASATQALPRNDESGRYLVEGTEVRFGQNGARRMVNLGIKVSEL